MADIVLQRYRAAFFRYVEANQPIELPQRGKENLSGIAYNPSTIICENTIEIIEPEKNHERTL